MDLAKLIRNIPDFPEPGIQFKDIESITENPQAFTFVIDKFAEAARQHHIDKILVLDARGFLFGAALGYREKLPVVMARKSGKLGGECVTERYALEYGTAEVQLQKTAIKKGDSVAIIDDLLATGGTAKASTALVKKLGGRVQLYAFVIELSELGGREKLDAADVVTLVKF
jgi:adenine phosphoribosyltransferase